MGNLSVEDARNKLASEGLSLAESVPQPVAGSVADADQDPAAGTNVAAGTEVTVTFNLPAAATVEVPDVENLSVEDARNKLAAEGLSLAESVPQPVAGFVAAADQDPAAGTNVAAGTEVTVTFNPPAQR